MVAYEGKLEKDKNIVERVDGDKRTALENRADVVGLDEVRQYRFDTALPPLGAASNVCEFDVSHELPKRSEFRDLPEHGFSVNEEGRLYVVKRGLGIYLLERLKQKVEGSAQDTILLRFDRVYMDIFLAEEMVQGLLEKDVFHKKHVVFVNTGERGKFLLDLLYAKRNDLGMVLDTKDSAWPVWYVGKPLGFMNSVLTELKRSGPATPQQISKSVPFSPADISRRLGVLFEHRLVRRWSDEHDKRGYVYEFFHPAKEFQPDVPTNTLCAEEFGTELPKPLTSS